MTLIIYNWVDEGSDFWWDKVAILTLKIEGTFSGFWLSKWNVVKKVASEKAFCDSLLIASERVAAYGLKLGHFSQGLYLIYTPRLYHISKQSFIISIYLHREKNLFYFV